MCTPFIEEKKIVFDKVTSFLDFEIFRFWLIHNGKFEKFSSDNYGLINLNLSKICTCLFEMQKWRRGRRRGDNAPGKMG